jgi:hypothetical protein
MDQLVKLVQERTGIGEEQARTAVDTVLDFVKDRLPAPIAGQVDGVVRGDAHGGGSPMDRVGSLFGDR